MRKPSGKVDGSLLLYPKHTQQQTRVLAQNWGWVEWIYMDLPHSLLNFKLLAGDQQASLQKLEVSLRVISPSIVTSSCLCEFLSVRFVFWYH